MKMFLKFTVSYLLAVLLLTGGTASAHGPQLQVSNQGGTIVTHDIFMGGPYESVSPARSVYVMPVLEDAGSWFTRPNTAERPGIGGPQFYSGPGLAYGSQVGTAEAFAVGEHFELQFTDGLQQWDGTQYVDPGAEQVRAFRSAPAGSSIEAITTDTAPFAALDFPEIALDYNAEAHSTARFQFLGDGTDPLAEPDDGVYLLSMSLGSTQVGLTSSDEYFFVMHKNAQDADILAAVASLGYSPSQVQYVGQVVPEPATFVSLLLASGGLMLFRRRSGPKRGSN